VFLQHRSEGTVRSPSSVAAPDLKSTTFAVIASRAFHVLPFPTVAIAVDKHVQISA
jgi:hypothetical protein